MTRKSKRELERDLEDLEASESNTSAWQGVGIVYEDPETGEWYDDPAMDGDPVDPEAADPLVVISDTVIETDWEGGS